MKSYDIEELYNLDFDLKKITAMEQNWTSGKKFVMKNPRHGSALIYVEKGYLQYYLPSGESFTVNEGMTVYLPKNSVYETAFMSDDLSNPKTLLLEFEAVDEDRQPFVFFDKIHKMSVNGIRDSFYEMINAYMAPNPSVSKLKAKTFGIIYKVIHSQKADTLKGSSDFSSIAKGIMYLENDPLQEMSISEIAAMCNVCVSGFRQLFKEYSGVSPNDYRIAEKISRAKLMLSSGNMTVKETANALGFTDCGYFCKLFKKKTGMSPGKYVNE